MRIQFLMIPEKTLQGVFSCEACCVADVQISKNRQTVKIITKNGRFFDLRTSDFQQLNKIFFIGNKVKYYSLIDNPVQEVAVTADMKSKIESEIENLEDIIDQAELEQLESEEAENA